jgi:hypothetical protein
LGLTILMLGVAACGTDAGAGSTTSTASPSTSTTEPATTTSTRPTTITASPPSTSTTEPGTTTSIAPGLPGEPVELGPVEGDVVAVIGVAHDDVLNLRAAPGVDQPILEGIPPLYDSLAALGRTRQLPGSLWIAVDYDGTDGWVNLRYIAYLGATTDETASIIASLGETPSAGTMEALGLMVAESVASFEDPVSDVVLTAAPTLGDLGEVTYDVVGLGDDAVRGLRLHVFGQPEGEEFTLKTVEITALCGRNVDDAGACV